METLTTFFPLILLFGLLWFLVIRPQQVQQRKRQEMLARLKRGDRVVTIGGIHGVVTAVADETIRLKITENVEVDLNKNGVGFIKEEEQKS